MSRVANQDLNHGGHELKGSLDRLVVDRIEGILGKLLCGLHVQVPRGTAYVRLTRSIRQQIGHCRAGRGGHETERTSSIEVGAGARPRTVRAVDHTAYLG